MTFRCTRHIFWFHFVLHPTTSCIRHCYFLLVCLFWLRRRWWHFHLHPPHFLLFVCLFWLQRGWDFVASAAILCFFVCLFWLQKSGWADSILCCIRQHHASGTVISFWYVFSDYKGGDDIFTCIRHNFLLFVCLFWLQKRGSHFVSFLTTKEVMTFSLASATIFCCLYVFRGIGRLGVRSLPHVDLGACGFSAPAFGMSSPL